LHLEVIDRTCSSPSIYRLVKPRRLNLAGVNDWC
jgi:hypothetical protein